MAIVRQVSAMVQAGWTGLFSFPPRHHQVLAGIPLASIPGVKTATGRERVN